MKSKRILDYVTAMIGDNSKYGVFHYTSVDELMELFGEYDDTDSNYEDFNEGDYFYKDGSIADYGFLSEPNVQLVRPDGTVMEFWKLDD